MYFSSRRRKEERAILEENVDYPEATVKEYLNMRRTTKDKCCLVTFCLYAVAIIILLGLAFFYGNYSNIGIFVSANGPCNSTSLYVSENFTTCLATCPSPNVLYLQHVCVSPSYNPSQSQSLASQIQIYNLASSFILMLYINVGILTGVIILFILLICFQRLVYLYIFLTFVLLLGFSFYLLKSINLRIQNKAIEVDSIFYRDENRMTGLAFTLLAGYLLFFPMILFSPRKIKIAVTILSNMYSYFTQMLTVMLLTCVIAVVTYGTLFLIAFLVMTMFTVGNQSIDSSSFFYLYTTKQFTHPVVLTIFFIGIYWIYGTLISWHKYLIGFSVCQWYFQGGIKLKAVRRGMKRSWHHLGSAAIDSFLTPLQWLILLVYSITKMDAETIEKYQNQNSDDCLCFSNCLYRFRTFINKIYCKINRNASVVGVLTNHPYIASCEMGAVTFAENKHRFFNVGGNLTLFLTLFSTLLWIFINYVALYYNLFNVSYPPAISSLVLPVVLSAFIGVLIGQILSNIFTVSIDCLLFCFLVEKKNGVEASTNEVKKVIEEIYVQQQEEEEVLEMYEVESED